MKRFSFRLMFTVILLVFSLAALIWGFIPGDRVIMRQKILPTEMQMPTPDAFYLPAFTTPAWM